MSNPCGSSVKPEPPYSQLFNNFLNIAKLLRREKTVIQNPVIDFSVLVFASKQFDRCADEHYHFMAALYAFCMMLDVAAGQIHAGEVYRIQKIFDAAAVLDFKSGARLSDGQFEAPDHIPVFLLK
jgi:hypothetical protein